MSGALATTPKDVLGTVDYTSLTTGERKQRRRLGCLVGLSLLLLTVLGCLGWYLYGHCGQSRQQAVKVAIDLGKQGRGKVEAPDTTAPHEFIPTSEWQVIPEGAILPPGLEIDIDFGTGARRARLFQPTHDIHRNLPMVPGKNMLEQRLDRVLSSDAATQLAALQALDLEAHILDMGILIARADNFVNLTSLLACEDAQLKRMAGDIIEACLHLNKPAVDAVLMSSLVERVVERLTQEGDAEMQRRLLNILTFAAEGCLEGLVYQFRRADGFDILEMLLAGGFTDGKVPKDPIVVRALALLATLAPIEDDNRERALRLLQKYLPLAQRLEFNAAQSSPFERTCQLPETSQLSNVRKFCKSHGK